MFAHYFHLNIDKATSGSRATCHLMISQMLKAVRSQLKRKKIIEKFICHQEDTPQRLDAQKNMKKQKTS